MRDAIAVDTSHQVGLKPTQKFIHGCSTTSSHCLDIGRSSQTISPSGTEKGRIARLLYHFEIFRRLFGYFGRMEDKELACVHDFLARQMVPAFNGITQHNIVWGEYATSFDVDFDD
ncbi:hypothetical protein F4811DRAFT_430281 [Daldinia bambusicola]|nr:hypothetical protein F4811DRAFT_430281 [Daldinia bambusicola]